MAFPTTSVLDGFGSAGAPPTGWTRLNTGSGTDIRAASGVCDSNSSSLLGTAYWNANSFGPDSEAYCTITATPLTGERMSLYVRCTSPGSSPGYYQIRYNGDGTWDAIVKPPGTGSSFLNSHATYTQVISAGDKIGMDCVGTTSVTVTAYWFTGGSWATIGTWTDSPSDPALQGAGNIGIGPQNQTGKADDFGGGTVVSGGAPTSGTTIPHIHAVYLRR